MALGRALVQETGTGSLSTNRRNRRLKTTAEFKKAAEIRDKAVKLLSVTGRSVFGD